MDAINPYNEIIETVWDEHFYENLDIDPDLLRRALTALYLRSENSIPPSIRIVDSPNAAQTLANELEGNKEGYHQWYEFMRQSDLDNVLRYRLGKMIKPGKFSIDLELLSSLCYAGVWDMILNESWIIVVKKPVALYLDEKRRLHCDTGPAVVFPDGAKYYFCHGKSVDPILEKEDVLK